MIVKIGLVMLVLGVSGLLFGWHKWGELCEQREAERTKKTKKQN